MVVHLFLSSRRKGGQEKGISYVAHGVGIMAEINEKPQTKILILATDSCAYPGADNVGQIHAEYPANTYIIRIPAPVLLPERFYLQCIEKGIDAVIVMSCGHECPYEGAYERLAQRIGQVQQKMRERGLDPRRLRLCAICTVCSRAFLKEINQMNDLLSELSQSEPTGSAEKVRQ